MRVLIVANLTPFLRGGADAHIAGIAQACREAGHDVECLRLPFAFNPEQEVRRSMLAAQSLDLQAPSGQSIDSLVSLQFPAYGVSHPRQTVWVMHQHRAVYELFNAQTASEGLQKLKPEIERFDQQHLGQAAQTQRLFANSKTVAQRLLQFNNLKAVPLYHPPPDHAAFYWKPAQNYIFYPSRFESLKRQLLLIEAAKLMRSPLTLVLAGEGGQWAAAKLLVEQLGLGDRVKLIGKVSAAEKIAWYANALSVCYPTQEEDYGYVTLEAMCAAKSVIICSDAGGPTEFVLHGETGLVVQPDPAALAQALDQMYENQNQAAQMGQAGRAHWESLEITWPKAVAALL